jgi:hypothetical protein
LIVEKFVFSVVPIPLTAVIITMLRPAAIRAYSIEVAPDSFLRNFEISNIYQKLLADSVEAPAPETAKATLNIINFARVPDVRTS